MNVSEDDERTVQQAYEVFRAVAKRWDGFLRDRREPDHGTIKQVFETVELVLRAYCRPSNALPDGRSKEHLPIPIAYLIANQIAYIRSGSLPGPVRTMVRPGSPGLGPHEHSDIGFAVGYVAAARGSLVQDRHPIKTIAERYGVKARTVRRWVQQHPSTQPTDFFVGTDGDDQLGGLLDLATKEAGMRYRQAGRGAEGRTEFPRPHKRPRADKTP